MRYVFYYEYLLRHGMPPAQTLRITHVRVVTVPSMEIKGGCAPYFTVEAGGTLVFDWKAHMGKVGCGDEHCWQTLLPPPTLDPCPSPSLHSTALSVASSPGSLVAGTPF